MKRIAPYLLGALLAVLFLTSGCNIPENNASAQPAVIQVEDITSIHTPYGVFHISEQWQQKLRCQVTVEEERYILSFYGQIPNREEQHLFRSVFWRK